MTEDYALTCQILIYYPKLMSISIDIVTETNNFEHVSSLEYCIMYSLMIGRSFEKLII